MVVQILISLFDKRCFSFQAFDHFMKMSDVNILSFYKVEAKTKPLISLKTKHGTKKGINNESRK